MIEYHISYKDHSSHIYESMRFSIKENALTAFKTKTKGYDHVKLVEKNTNSKNSDTYKILYEFKIERLYQISEICRIMDVI